LAAPEEQAVFLSSMPASERHRRLALVVVAVSAALFLLLVPVAKVQLASVPAFIPVYQSALVVTDLITAALLFGQFSILRHRAMLALASAYLFTALLAAIHAMTFPGLFAPAGLLGAGPQSTAWLYMFWHGGFPLLVIAYAWLKPIDRDRPDLRGRTSLIVLGTIAAAVALAVACGLIATAGQEALPPIMTGNRYTPAMIGVVSSVWVFSAFALVALWRQPPYSILDVWLMVTLCAWIFDIALSAVLNQGRFDVGFYAGRAYGLAAASFVLLVLLLENIVLHNRLARALASERRERALVQQKTAELAAANKELEAFAYSVSHDLRAPLRAVDGYARILEEDYGERMDDEGRRKLAILCASTRNMGQLIDDLLALSRLARHPLALRRLAMDELVQQSIEDVRPAAEGRDVRFVVDPLGEARGDPILVKQVLLNLIGNAVKFTRGRQPGTIEIGTRDDPDGTRLFFVKDNGAGFDMQYAGKLFGVFQRLHHAEEFEGTGVGLAIVRRLVERLGGRVWAESRPGEGAAFFFTLGRDGPRDDQGT
jgi:signal transduction histidine kinase